MPVYERETDTYVKAWEDENGNLLYVDDRFTGTEQSVLDDFSEGRYEVRIDRKRDADAELVDDGRFYDAEEAVRYAESLIGDE